MLFRRLPAALAVAAALLPAAAAHADAPWSAPSVVPGASAERAPLVLTRAGNGVLVDASNRTNHTTEGAPSVLAPLFGDGRPRGTVHALPLAAAGVVTYASDRIVVAGSTLDDRGLLSDRSHVQVGFGSAGGDLGPLRGLTGSTGERLFAISANEAGDVALVTGNLKRRRVWIRRHGGAAAFRVALTITVGRRARDATVSVGRTGDVLVVWEDAHHVYARHIGPTGGLGRTTRVGDGVESHLQAAVGPDRRLSVAWMTQLVHEGDAASPAQGFFATAAPGHGFGPARALTAGGGPTGTGRYVSDPAIRLLVAAGGTTRLALTVVDAARDRFVVQAREITGGHLGAPQVVSDPARNAVLADLAVGADGAAVVVWRVGVGGADPDGTAPGVLAAASPAAGRPFGAAETVTGPDLGGVVAPTAALGSAQGHALVAIPAFVGSASVQEIAARAPIAP